MHGPAFGGVLLRCAIVLVALRAPTAAQPLRFWLPFNETPIEAKQDSSLDDFLARWEKTGILLSSQRTIARTNVDFRRLLMGQSAILAELAEFRRQNPQAPPIEVQFYPWSDYLGALRSASPAPDLFQVPSTWCASLAGLGMLQTLPEPLDQQANANFQANLLSSCRRKGSQDLYGLPWVIDVRIMYFRRDDLPDLESELRQVRNAREAFRTALREGNRDSGRPLFALPIERDWELLHHIALLTWGEGGELLSEPAWFGLRSQAPSFREPALRGLIYLRDLARDGLIEFPNELRSTLDSRFIDGKLGSVISGPWVMRELMESATDPWDQTIGLTLPPLYETPEEAVSFLGGSYLGISGKNPALVDAASQLATHLSLTEAALRIGSVPAATNLLGNVAEAAKWKQRPSGPCSTYFNCLAEGTADPAHLSPIERAIQVGRSYPAIAEWSRIEAESALASVHHVWQDVSTLKGDTVLEADLRQVEQDWRDALKDDGSGWIWGVSLAFAVVAVGLVLHRTMNRGDSEAGKPGGFKGRNPDHSKPATVTTTSIPNGGVVAQSDNSPEGIPAQSPESVQEERPQTGQVQGELASLMNSDANPTAPEGGEPAMTTPQASNSYVPNSSSELKPLGDPTPLQNEPIQIQREEDRIRPRTKVVKKNRVPDEEIPDRLFAAIHRQGLSQKEVAGTLGVDRGTLSAWLEGTVPRGENRNRVENFILDDEAFPQNLRQTRELRHLTEDEAARELKIDWSTYSQWEDGSLRPASVEQRELARRFIRRG